jgi:PIN domain nuclease of toxin-antitoxin system
VKLLLDTNVVIWMTGRTDRIKPAVRAVLGDSRNALFVSTASLLEIASKVSRGRLDFNDEVLGALQQTVSFLSVSESHAWRVATLPPLHTDPFDRLFVAQAIIEGMTLVTGDAALASYDVPILLT